MSAWSFVDGAWLHRPWWKVAINTVLRAVQPQRRKWLIYSRCFGGGVEPPICVGYGFGRVTVLSGPSNRIINVMRWFK